jgi:hypothetical protein
MPTPSPVAANIVLMNQALLNYSITQGSITFPVNPPPTGIQQITVYACTPSTDSKAVGADCPTATDNYTIIRYIGIIKIFYWS